MAEEQETTGGSLKNILIGLVSTVTLGVGGFITNKLTGGEEEAKTEVALWFSDKELHSYKTVHEHIVM